MSNRLAPSIANAVWALVASQHGVVSRQQLLELGLTAKQIEHRIRAGRLHPVHYGVYAAGRRELTREGCFMAAVLACGDGALLSHASAAALWRIRGTGRGLVEVAIPGTSRRRRSGIVVHRKELILPGETTKRHGIPVTSPIHTLIDIAPRLTKRQLEAAVNEADAQGLVDPERLRVALHGMPRRPGIKPLRELLDRQTFTLTRSELERLFLPLARAAGLPKPETRYVLNGFEVDFYWPELGLVVETDGLRYHRTPAQQQRDRLRDQAHAVAGLTPLRFTHAQVKYEPHHVQATLTAVAARLAAAGGREVRPPPYLACEVPAEDRGAASDGD